MKIESNQEKVEKKVLYAQAVYGDEEKQAVMDSLENGWLASGPKVKEFEEQMAKLFGKKYGVATNSGSSANLLALSAMHFPKGSKIITPALTFATTVSEIVLNGFVPLFIDGVIGRYTIDEEQIERVLKLQGVYQTGGNIVAILVPQLVGGVCNMSKLRELADKYDLILIDDSCDTIAPMIGDRTVASYSDVTTTSFYGSHIITACGMGGMAMTDDEKLRDEMITLRDWGRIGNDKEDFETRFDCQVDGIPYDAKFLYSHLGYNLKMNEVAAAFGLEQIKKLPEFLKTRAVNFGELKYFFTLWKQFFHLPYLFDEKVITNWLAFPLTIVHDAPFTRYEFLKHLEAHGIQTRVLFSGNITRHPVYKGIDFRIFGRLVNADFVMANGLLLGCHQGMDREQVDYLCKVAGEFLQKYV